MTIIFKPGNPEELETFECVFCGCEFGTDEFTVNSISHAHYDEELSVPCPCCGQTVKSFRRKFYD